MRLTLRNHAARRIISRREEEESTGEQAMASPRVGFSFELLPSLTTTTTTKGRILFVCSLLVVIVGAASNPRKISERVSEDFDESSSLESSAHDHDVSDDDNRTAILRQGFVSQECGSHRARGLRRIDRIAGGYDANEAEFPSYVRLSIDFGKEIGDCGGTIISQWLVLTASHCFLGWSGGKRIRVRAGGTRRASGIEYRARSICLPGDPGDFSKDYAIVIMDKPFEFNERVQPACLPSFDVDSRMQAHIVGFGFMSKRPDEGAERLQVLPVKRHLPCSSFLVGPNAICFLSNVPRYTGDSCQGDSGGPVYVTVGSKQTLVGIVSRGVAECRKGYSMPSVNVDVFKLRSKIDNMIKRCWR